MIFKEEHRRSEYVLDTARAMMAAARTAPKGKGVDNLEICVLTGSDLQRLSRAMVSVGERIGQEFFMRDAGNVASSDALVLIGMKPHVRGLDCALCGYDTCALKTAEAPRVPCVFNVTDLGIALGSAVSVAAGRRVDNRIMYSAGAAAMEIGILKECTAVFAIPLSCSGKSPYFDRKHGGHK